MPERPEVWDPLAACPSARRLLWGLLAAAALVAQGPGFVRSLRPAPGVGVDFFQEWASAKNYWRGLPIYADQARTAPLHLGHRLRPGEVTIARNAHPPSSVLLALPFAALSYEDATLAWNLASLAALGASLWMVGQGLGLRAGPGAILPAVALGLVCNPLRQQVNQGQLNLVLLLILTGAWASDRSGRPRLAGFLVGAATAIKVFPGFLLLYFLLRRRPSAVASGIAGLAAISALTAAILGADAYRSYVVEVLPHISQYRTWWPNASLLGFWLMGFDLGATFPAGHPSLPRHLPPIVSSPWPARVGLLLSGAAVLAAWARAVLRARTREETDRAFGLSLTAMLLLSPITWDHYFVLLLLPAVQLWITPSAPLGARVLLLTLLAILWAAPLDLWLALTPAPRTPGEALAPSVGPLAIVSLQGFALLGLFLAGLGMGEGEAASARKRRAVPSPGLSMD